MTAPVGDDAVRTPLALLYEAGKGLYVSDTRSNQIKLIPESAL